MLATILNRKPATWEEASYDSQRYHLFELDVSDREYDDEIVPFRQDNLVLAKLERVQNPFQWARFKIRKEQKEYRNVTADVVKFYHCIHNADLEVALEHNLDVRRYKYTTGSSHHVNSKNPKFYNTPGTAYNSNSNTDKVILICNVLENSYSVLSSTCKDNDAEYMPIYVAHIY
uniref:PARP catalytic domain-containing protein n=1 Tax=Graphocephala atropunctata TaxID=36148 RepID=A0A1B6KCB4_9HEMI